MYSDYKYIPARRRPQSLARYLSTRSLESHYSMGIDLHSVFKRVPSITLLGELSLKYIMLRVCGGGGGGEARAHNYVAAW